MSKSERLTAWLKENAAKYTDMAMMADDILVFLDESDDDRYGVGYDDGYEAAMYDAKDSGC